MRIRWSFRPLWVVLFLGVVCGRYQNSNPYDPVYPGSYGLSVFWDSLPDTLEVLRLYEVPWVSTGADTFRAISASASIAHALDTSLYAAGGRLSPLPLYFRDTMSGAVRVRGVRPNERVNEYERAVRVINPYAVVCDTVAGRNSGLRATIGYRGAMAGPAESLWVVWSVNGRRVDSLAAGGAMRWLPDSSTRAVVGAALVDRRGNRLALDPVAVRIGGYAPVLDSVRAADTVVLGDTIRITAFVRDSDGTRVRLIVWMGGEHVDSTRGYVSTGWASGAVWYGGRDTGALGLRIVARDSGGLASDTLRRAVWVRRVAPVVRFVSDPIAASAGDSVTLEVYDSVAGAVRYAWEIGGGADTTAQRRVRRLYSDTGSVWAVCRGIDRYGYGGPADTARIVVGRYGYALSAVRFADTVRARRAAVWTVRVNDPQRLASRGGRYCWTIQLGGLTVLDSSGAGMDSVAWTVGDSASMRVSVYVRDSLGDVSPPLSRQVVVREYRPSLAFESRSVVTRILKDTLLRVTATDSAGGGRVDSIEWLRGGGDTLRTAGSQRSLRVSYAQAGAYVVRARARDDDGFYSAWDSAVVEVKSDRPYVQGAGTGDTTVLYNTGLLMRARFVPGELNVPIVKYLWSCRGAQSWQDSTTADTLRRLFNAVGRDTIVVSCRDRDGLGSATADTFVVTVNRGEPRVSALGPDTVWLFDDTLYTIRAYSPKPQGRVAGWAVQWGDGGGYESFTDSTMRHRYLSAGRKARRAFVTDGDGFNSDTMADTVLVLEGRPRVVTIGLNRTVDTVLVNEALQVRVKGVDPNGRIDSVLVSWDGDSALESRVKAVGDSGSASHTYALGDTGLATIRVRVLDDDTLPGDSIVTVRVRSGAPAITQVRVDTAALGLYAGVGTRFVVKGAGIRAAISTVRFSWNGDATFEDSVSAVGDSGSVSHSFTVADSGSRSVRVRIEDSRGIVKDSSVTIVVKAGYPQVGSVTLDTAEGQVFVLDARKVRVTANDPNGQVRRLCVNWSGGTTAQDSLIVNGPSVSDSISHTFALADSGPRTVTVWAVDNDGLRSATVSAAVTVRVGRPWVTAITPSAIWVNDDTLFTLTAGDTNGTVDSLIVDWGDGTPLSRQLRSAPLRHRYSYSQAGTKNVKVVVRDEDRLLSDTLRATVTVNAGAPVVSAVRIDTTGDNLFVRDMRAYTVTVTDPNSDIRRLYAAWNGESAPVESITILRPTLAAGGIDTFFTHAYDTTMSGSRAVRFWAMDVDTVRSETSKDTTVSVRLGAPRLWANTGDTLWLIVDKGYTTGSVHYFAKPGSYDSNGVNNKPVRWYWNTSNSIAGATVTSVDSLEFSVNGATINGTVAYEYLFCRDEDSLLRGNVTGNRMVVFADSAPPAPTVSHNAPAGDSITIYWKNKDVKDGDSTQYRILLREGAEPDSTRPQDILVNWKKGFRASDDTFYDWMYRYKMTANNPKKGYYYQVHARDARETVSPCTPGHTFSY